MRNKGQWIVRGVAVFVLMCAGLVGTLGEQIGATPAQAAVYAKPIHPTDKLIRPGEPISPMVWEHGLQIGAVLQPNSRPDNGSSAEMIHYTLQPGDTILALARRYGVTVDAMREANGWGQSEILAAGETILIPRSATAP